MASISRKKIERELKRQVDKQYNKSIEIPSGLTEDEAVASLIEQYKSQTGIELPDADAREAVREAMNGQERTP